MNLYCFNCEHIFKANEEGARCPNCNSDETVETELEAKCDFIECCPICDTELEHFEINYEDIFGCPKCKKEITYNESVKKAK